jgi:hypothetical protein
VLEYFISTTVPARVWPTPPCGRRLGYLTVAVDVSQDVIIREDDCGTERVCPSGSATARTLVKTRTPRRAYAGPRVEIGHPETGESRRRW